VNGARRGRGDLHDLSSLLERGFCFELLALIVVLQGPFLFLELLVSLELVQDVRRPTRER
jgi:hypothetical protein